MVCQSGITSTLPSVFRMMKDMKYIRFSKGQTIGYGILDGKTVHVLDRNFLDGGKDTGTELPLSEVRLLAPVVYSKECCIGLNYRDHAAEFNLALPESPVVFLKPSTALLGPEEKIHYPGMSSHLDYEGELAVVIGKTAKDVHRDDAAQYIFGYCCANDVTARDLQPKQGQWTVAKGFDTFGPIGPFIETEIDPSSLKLQTKVNGVVKQSSNTANLIFNVPYLVSYLSHVMTLLPGDIISTGTPSGISRLEHGDVVEVSIEGLGVLRNTVD